MTSKCFSSLFFSWFLFDALSPCLLTGRGQPHERVGRQGRASERVPWRQSEVCDCRRAMEPLESLPSDLHTDTEFSAAGVADEEGDTPQTCPLCGRELAACPVGADKCILLCPDPDCLFPLDQPDLSSFVLAQHTPAAAAVPSIPDHEPHSSDNSSDSAPAPLSMMDMLRRAAQSPHPDRPRRTQPASTPPPHARTQPPQSLSLPTAALQPMQPLSFSSLSFT